MRTLKHSVETFHWSTCRSPKHTPGNEKFRYSGNYRSWWHLMTIIVSHAITTPPLPAVLAKRYQGRCFWLSPAHSSVGPPKRIFLFGKSKAKGQTWARINPRSIQDSNWTICGKWAQSGIAPPSVFLGRAFAPPPPPLAEAARFWPFGGIAAGAPGMI